MNQKKTIQINPELFKVSNKKQSQTEARRPVKTKSLNTIKNRLINRTKPMDSSGNLQDAVQFLSNITDKKKWVDVNLEFPDDPPMAAAAVETISSNNSNNSNSIPQNPPYGCLKSGQKPTYRSWLRNTQKNNLTTAPPLPSNYNFKTLITEDDSKKVDLNTMATRDVLLNEKLEKELAVIDELKTLKPEVKQKVKTKTFKKHVIGKNTKRRTITVLLKDAEKKRQVTEAKQNLKNENIDKIRDFLIKHNLLKASSYAPNNILLKMFENAKLTGDVYNTNVSSLMNNILIPS